MVVVVVVVVAAAAAVLVSVVVGRRVGHGRAAPRSRKSITRRAKRAGRPSAPPHRRARACSLGSGAKRIVALRLGLPFCPPAETQLLTARKSPMSSLTNLMPPRSVSCVSPAASAAGIRSATEAVRWRVPHHHHRHQYQHQYRRWPSQQQPQQRPQKHPQQQPQRPRPSPQCRSSASAQLKRIMLCFSISHRIVSWCLRSQRRLVLVCGS